MAPKGKKAPRSTLEHALMAGVKKAYKRRGRGTHRSWRRHATFEALTHPRGLPALHITMDSDHVPPMADLLCFLASESNITLDSTVVTIDGAPEAYEKRFEANMRTARAFAISQAAMALVATTDYQVPLRPTTEVCVNEAIDSLNGVKSVSDPSEGN